MRTRTFLLLALVVMPGSSPIIAQIPSLDEIPQLNMEVFPPETREQVRQAYEAAREHPQDPDAVGKLGMLLDLYDRTADAILCYRRAHELDPRSFKWLYYWGSILVQKKMKDEAVRVLTSAVQIKPDYLPAKLKLAEAIRESGNIEDTRKIYEAILKDHPDSAEALYGLGRVYAARGDMADALEFYNKACELFPTYGAAHYALAIVYRKLGQAGKAQEHLEVYEHHKNVVPPVDDPLRDQLRALDMSATSYLERGAALEQVGRFADAIAATERATQLDPKLVLAHNNLIILYGRQGNVQKAEEHYRAVLALNPDQFPKAHYDYGVLLMQHGRYEEAVEAFRRAIHANPSYAEAYNNLGVLLQRQGKISEALEEFKKAVESRPDYRQAHFNLGRILVNQGNYQGAIEEFEKTLSPADGNTPSYLYALGATYGRAGDRQKALRYLQQAREEALAHGQTSLVSSIDQDLRALKAQH